MNGRVQSILDAASVVNVLDVAARVVANPARYGPATSVAQVVALAHAVERFWEVALEADLLVRAIALPSGSTAFDALRGLRIEGQAARIVELMAAIRGEPSHQEKSDGSGNS